MALKWSPEALVADGEKAIRELQHAAEEAKDDVIDAAKQLVGSQTNVASTIEKSPEGAIEVGADYAWYIENGSAEVDGKLMVFQSHGQTVFTRKRKAIPAKPFFKPATEQFGEFLARRMA